MMNDKEHLESWYNAGAWNPSEQLVDYRSLENKKAAAVCKTKKEYELYLKLK